MKARVPVRQTAHEMERICGAGTCLWASEIEEFPMAVTKYHFGEG